MLELKIILILVWIHFVADFLLQNERIANNKSSKNVILLEHVILYSIPFLPFGLKFTLVNSVLHFFVDYVTSRMTTKLWLNKNYYWFFKAVGLDQALHFTCLFVTAYYLL